MRKSTHSLLVPYLAVLATGLCGFTWWRATAQIDTSPVEDAATAPLTSQSADSPVGTNDVRPLSALSETVVRPLFNSNRKPFIAPVSEVVSQDERHPEAAQKAELDAGMFRLIGLMTAGASKQRALIRLSGAPAAEWLEAGAEIGGWTLDRFEKDKVILLREGTTAELLLRPLPADKAPNGKTP
jgi:hypothetical protein